MKIQIKDVYFGRIICEYDAKNIKEVVEKAVNKKIDLTDANLTNVNLIDANLTNADLQNANLTNADLRNADLTDANLTDANLTGANLRNITINEKSFKFIQSWFRWTIEK